MKATGKVGMVIIIVIANKIVKPTFITTDANSLLLRGTYLQMYISDALSLKMLHN